MAKNSAANKKGVIVTSFYIALSRFRTKDHSKIFEIGEDVSELNQDELDSLVERKLVSTSNVESKVMGNEPEPKDETGSQEDETGSQEDEETKDENE